MIPTILERETRNDNNNNKKKEKKRRTLVYVVRPAA